MTPSYDLIIVGGGLVGAGLALALAKKPLRIAVVEARMPLTQDPRLFALNYSSCQFLKNVGVWSAIAEHAAPIQQVHVSHRGKFGSLRLNAHDLKCPTLGAVIPAFHVESVLQKALSDVDLFRPATLTQLTQLTEGVEVTLQDLTGEKVLRAKVVIGADGGQSTVRQLLNFATTYYDYHQIAIVTKMSLARSHQQIAYERFIEGGAIAMLPLPDNQCATIWSCDSAQAQSLLALSDEAFLASLQQNFGYRLGKLLKTHERFSYPLHRIQTSKIHQGNVLLLGNAAHTLHPLAAQGFNLAIYEVAALVEAIDASLNHQNPLTGADLAATAARTKQQRSASTQLTHALTQAFAKKSMINDLFLQLGMIGLDTLPIIKGKMLKRMVGREGKVPRLLLSS